MYYREMAEKNNCINNRYIINEYLGRGGFSKVMKCYDQLRNCQVALKMISDKGFDDRREIEIMKILASATDPRANIAIKYLDSFTFNKRDYMVIELGGINLYDFLYDNREIPYSLSFIRSVARQTVQFLSYLHSRGIIHCDIKPENIMLKKDDYEVVTITDDTCANPDIVKYQHTRVPIHDEIKVIDFGLATFSENRLHFSTVGTRPYCSPEMLLQDGWSYATDLWSVGCTLLEMYIGYQIFTGKSEREQLLKMEMVLGKFPHILSHDSHYFSKSGYVICETPHNFDPSPLHRLIDHSRHPQFLDFCTQLLCLNPEKRITCTNALNHPFLNYID
ncbi:protein kinase, putative [Entamoeba nuttalli P19]|uniref:Protein kinase, putative n=2 Tax=Entamoeba nuttalli TaxID=412467 RepID=K2GS98_ENTNP|nr:protein kinase, putative [Entamoeba nuttalli P19]EKE37883.1 protein kinase, putative [Entamoeba nuttalli P19]|eukprot:XP_008859767.1 protein kinase, putative [Entamoeba nuttalli P19]